MAADKQQTIEELARVRHMGPHLAELAYEQLGVRSVPELIAAAETHRLRTLSGVGLKKEAAILKSALAFEKVRAIERSQQEPAEAAGEKREATPRANGHEQGPRASVRGEELPHRPGAAREEPSAPQPLRHPPETPEEQTVAGIKPLVQRFVETLRCPVCGHDGLELRSASLCCEACHREYAFQHGIADLAPPQLQERSVTQRIMETRFYARYYEDVMRPRLTHVVTDRTMREEYVLSAQMLELDDAESVLDVACGTGNFTRYFAQRMLEGSHGSSVPLIVGMDLSWPMLETARTYLRREGLEDKIYLLRGDATNLPIQRAAFDRIHCAGALHMMPSVDEALRNFSRVLAPGGILVIGTFVLGEGLLRRILKRVAELPTRFHWFAHDELHRRMESAGLEVIEESTEGDAITLKAIRR